MSIAIPQLKQLLIEHNVEYLYHANTVATAVTFLSYGGLLSRGAVEEQNLFQTPQESDSLDKQLGVFFNIFFDSDDIHARAHDINAYGPNSIDVFDTLLDKVVKVTKDNPIRWDETTTETERYFTELIPMSLVYHKGAFQQHLTICNMHDPLAFSPYLVKVLIENPNIPNTVYFDKAVDTIQNLLECNGLDVPLEVRQCSNDCNCQVKYKSYKGRLSEN